MANLVDAAEFTENEVYQIAATDEVTGAETGAEFGGVGIDNYPHQQLANRTWWLYLAIQAILADLGPLGGVLAGSLPNPSFNPNDFATVAQLWAGTASGLIVPPSVLSASRAPQTLPDASPIAWDMAKGYNAKMTLLGNRTIAKPTNIVLGGTHVLQINSGAGGFATTFNACFDFGLPGAPALSTAANKNDFIFMYCYDASTPLFRCTFSPSA